LITQKLVSNLECYNTPAFVLTSRIFNILTWEKLPQISARSYHFRRLEGEQNGKLGLPLEVRIENQKFLDNLKSTA